MKKSKTKIFWISIAIGCLIVFTLMLLSSVINIGERLRKIHVSVEIAFYVLVFLIVFLVIINPIRIILTSPSFEICTTLDPDSHKVRSVYRAVARNMAKNQNRFSFLYNNIIQILFDTIMKNYRHIHLKLIIIFIFS